MTNYENRLVYLNSAGAQRTFGDADLVGLPVIPTDPVLVDGVIVYSEVFVKPFDYSDTVVPVRCLSHCAFDESVPDSVSQSAREMFLLRHAWKDGDVESASKLLGTPQTVHIPTLQETYP